VDLIWRFAAHEVGHEFGLDHILAPVLMGWAEGPASTSQYFVPSELNYLRNRQQSPGR
jgi:hypothetical protein